MKRSLSVSIRARRGVMGRSGSDGGDGEVVREV